MAVRTPEDVAYFFSNYLTHVEGELAGQPFHLTRWQYDDIIKPIFGSTGPDGFRTITKSYVELPRKNGKSTLAAGIALFLLFADGEPGAQVVSAAANLKQARICFKLARKMVEKSEFLSSRCTIYKDAIETHDGSVYHAISSAADTKDGLNCHGIIFDELHAQKNSDLLDVLDSSRGSRRQPLTFMITTAGHDRESICYEIHNYAKMLKEGAIDPDPSFHSVIYGANDEDDWRDPEVWKKANPGYGVTCFEKFFRDTVRQAKNNRLVELNFRRKNLDQWTETATGWIPLDVWDHCRGEIPDLSGEECFVGLDMSSTTDLTAMVLCFSKEGKYFLVPYAWAPEAVVHERERRNKTKYSKWIADGHLFQTEGDVIDEDAIYQKFLEVNEKYRVSEVRLDRWNAGYMAQRLSQHTKVEFFGQGYYSMGQASKEFERLIRTREVVHSGNPVHRWCLANTSVVDDDAGNIKPSKKVSREKIDLTVSSIMALAGARLRDGGKGISIYETRGMRSV